jgi:hypothetical protein
VAEYTEPRRRGVQAGRRIAAGEIIERAPVVLIPAEDEQALDDTDLAPFLEDWPGGTGSQALPLGFAAMYRRARTPNARLLKIPEDMVIEVVAAQDIEVGEEITVPDRG